MIIVTQKVVDVLKPREAYLLFLGKGGGSMDEFRCLPKSFNAGDDVLYEACGMLIVDEVPNEAIKQTAQEGNIWQLVCEEMKSADVEIGGAL